MCSPGVQHRTKYASSINCLGVQGSLSFLFYIRFCAAVAVACVAPSCLMGGGVGGRWHWRRGRRAVRFRICPVPPLLELWAGALGRPFSGAPGACAPGSSVPFVVVALSMWLGLGGVACVVVLAPAGVAGGGARTRFYQSLAAECG